MAALQADWSADRQALGMAAQEVRQTGLNGKGDTLSSCFVHQRLIAAEPAEGLQNAVLKHMLRPHASTMCRSRQKGVAP